MADTVGLLKREHADSDRGSSDTADDGPVDDDGRSRNVDHHNSSRGRLVGRLYDSAYSDLSSAGDSFSIDTSFTSPSTGTSGSSPLHYRSDGSNLSARSRYLASNGTVRKEKEREREERVKVAREKLADERKKKIEELKEQQRLAQEHRERQQELRRRKIEELRRREEERRAAVDERRRKQEEDQRIRREAILQRAQDRVARYEQWKQSGRHRGGHIYGFGSRTPRDICLPLDRKRSSSHSTLLRCSVNDSDSDCYVRPQRRAVSACSMVRRHCCVDVKASGKYPASSTPSKHLSVSTSALYYKRSPEFSSSGNLTSTNRPESLLAPAPPHRTKSSIGLHTSSASVPVKTREMHTPRKPRPASLAGTLPGFVPLEVPKANTPRSKSTERISKDKLRNRSSTIDSAKSDKSVGSATSSQSKGSRKAIFDRLSTPKKPADTPPKSAEKKSSAPNSGTTTPTPRKPKSTKDKGPRESPNREGTPTPSEDAMTRSTQEITEEEYKIKLAEKRRQAREKAEREAELERQRQEELRRQEEERLRAEEEEERRMEEESLRLAAEGRLAEEERLRKAIEAEELRRKEEAQRLELERKQKEEAEKKAKEEAERLEKERIERAKREEEERLARKKRLEMIMKRVKTETNVVDAVKTESLAKSAQSSPSKSSNNSSTELSPDERPEESPATLDTNHMKKASSQEDVQSIEDDRSPAKFKSPLLKQLMDKRSDESTGDQAKFKSPILQNILSKSKTNLGNRLLKTNSSEKLSSSQENLDVSFYDSNSSPLQRSVDGSDHKLTDKDNSINRLTASFDQSVGMDDSGFADSNGTKVPHIVDVNGTDRTTEVSSVAAVSSIVDNHLDNKPQLTPLPAGDTWTTSPKHCPASNQPLSGVTVASDRDSLVERNSQGQMAAPTLIDLSVTNKNIELKTQQQLQDTLLNNTEDLLNFNSINSAATGGHNNTLLTFEDNATQRQDVSELI
ncbi:ensconsin-like [Argonauta hians]